MMESRQEAQIALFYGFSTEGQVPDDQTLRAVDLFVDVGDIRQRSTAPPGGRRLIPDCRSACCWSATVRLGAAIVRGPRRTGIRSERRLCEEVHLNLAYRWFCRLDLTDPVPDHSTYPETRHGRFHDSGLLG